MMKLNYVVIYASDLRRSSEFYRQLGFELTEEKHGNGPKHYSLSVGDIVVEIYPTKNSDVSRIRLGIVADENSNLVELFGSDDRRLVADPDGNVWEFTRRSPAIKNV